MRSFVDGETITTPDGYKITIVAHPEAVRVSYAAVDALVPRLWEEAGWDYVLHVGVGFEGGFQLETRAWVNGYVMKDVDGEAPEEGGGRMKDVHGGEGGGGEGEVVRTGVDVPWVVGLVEKEVVVSGVR